MTKHYADYVWKNGRPRGLSVLPPDANLVGISYKIIADPYFKRISVEKYQSGTFSQTIYDSALFDFRHLKAAEQASWQKTTVSETENQVICHIRNQDDRLVLIEEYSFENQLCRSCITKSPQNVTVSIQKIQYSSLGDPFNGVILYDINEHTIMSKRYKIDEETLSFTDLIEESSG